MPGQGTQKKLFINKLVLKRPLLGQGPKKKFFTKKRVLKRLFLGQGPKKQFFIKKFVLKRALLGQGSKKNLFCQQTKAFQKQTYSSKGSFRKKLNRKLFKRRVIGSRMVSLRKTNVHGNCQIVNFSFHVNIYRFNEFVLFINR